VASCRWLSRYEIELRGGAAAASTDSFPALSDIQRERTTYKISATTKAAREAGTTTGGMNRFRQLAIIIAGGDS
jgi:hypothetical protein